MKNPLDQLALTMSINFLRMMSDIEQPENCKAFIPMHRTVYEFTEGYRVANVEFLGECKESVKNVN